MDLGLQDRGALVTGASRGIGHAAAEALAEAGCRLAVNARGEASLGNAAADLRAWGAEVTPVPGDLADADELARVVDEAEDALGGIDVLVANAGGPPPGGVLDLTDGDWRAAFELTLMSPLRLMRRVVPGMRERGWGRVVVVTSISVLEPIPNLAASNVMRAGVTAAVKTLADEVAGDGVTVNCVAPGYTDTERLSELGRDLDEIAGEVPAGRLAEPREIGDAVAWLASERAGYVTGRTLAVEGGRLHRA